MSLHDSDQSANTQPAELKRKAVGKARVKPRHLSAVVKQLIIDKFQVVQSTEDIAEEYGIPVRTVNDVLLLAQMRRGPEPARGAFQVLRRTA